MIWTGADYLRAVGIEHDYKKEVLARTIVELEKQLEESKAELALKDEEIQHRKDQISNLNDLLNEVEAERDAAVRIARDNYRNWQVAGGPNECEHGIVFGISCRDCDIYIIDHMFDQPKEKEC